MIAKYLSAIMKVRNDYMIILIYW